MKNFETYFSERQIIKFLANKRAKAAKDVHDNQFLRNISRNAKKPFDPKKREELYKLLPYRNDWIRFRKEERIKFSNSKSLNAAQIERTVWRDHKKVLKGLKKEPEWYIRIFSLIEEIHKRALSDQVKLLSNPRPIPVVKDEKEKTYRCISSFDNLVEQILISQTAKYLTDILDPLFEDCSFAFRSKMNQNKFTHHLSVREIIEFKMKYRGRRLYAAECDIQKFYDTINHSVIRDRFYLMVGELKEKGKMIDKRAIDLFEAYLACYAFNTDIFPNEQKILKKNNINKGKIAWVELEEFEKVGSNIYEDRIGVPQGGALSCLIANIVLDYADKQILEMSHRSLYYARFCDDIIIIHPQKKQCRRVYNKYLNSLKELKLIAHQAEVFDEYGSEFWKIKSKKPYVWNRINKRHRLAKRNVPWLAFVGYQIKYDGKVRVRPSSVKKELKKQVEEANKLIKNLPDSESKRLKKRNIVFRFSQRLIAMSVGRVNRESTSMSWTAGFNVLKDNPVRKWQLRKLDKNRNVQISRVKKHLGRFEEFESEEVLDEKDGPRVKDYYGFKYSYYYQFVNKKGHD